MADVQWSDYSYRCAIFGHTADVRCMFSPDIVPNGMISGSRDTTVKVWQPAGPHQFVETQVMTGASNFIASLTLLPASETHPNGLILAGCNDGIIYGFNVESSELVMKLAGHNSTVCSLVTGYGDLIISASWDTTARMWIGRRCANIMVGHSAPVWAVTKFENSDLILTGSADRTIKLWELGGHCKRTYKGHEDCVRGLAITSVEEFISCSNDATIRLWAISGTCLYVFVGHTSYIFGITLIGSSGNLFASCGEDHSVRIWQNETCVQTIYLPFKTAWCVTALSNGDIAVGGCDGSIRVFTQHKELQAPSSELKSFNREVTFAVQHSKLTIGDLKLEDVAGLDAISKPGVEDGQTVLCQDSAERNKVFVYQWSNEEQEWTKIGEVTDAKFNKKQMFEGVEYDYVFQVQLDDGQNAMLPYNDGENPYSAARRFIERNDLNALFLDQIANFIMQNRREDIVLQETLFDTSVDPFTGQSRYVPGNMQPMQSAASTSHDIKREEVQSVKEANYFPQTDYIKFNSANMDGLERKLMEFNGKVHPTLRINDHEVKSVMQLGNMPTTISEEQMEILDKIMLWPADLIFPVLDLFRLAVRCEEMDKRIGKVGSAVIGSYLLKHLESGNFDTNRMLIFRTLCNMFGHQCGESVIVSHFQRICDITMSCVPTSHDNTQVAIATLYLNFAVAVNKSLLSNPLFLSENIIKLLVVLTNSEALFRLLVAIGTLFANSIAKEYLVQSDMVKNVIKISMKKDVGEKVVACAKCLIEFLLQHV